jgi:L-lactate dehydrogenase (cytochrome)
LVRLKNCYKTEDFRKLAKRRLPSPIFHYIDGGADDEITLRRNSAAFDVCDLVPNVLAGVDNVDLSTEVLGQRLDFPLLMSPTAMQRLFHHDGERALAKAAEKLGTMFGVSTIGTRSIEELGAFAAPKMFQIYVHNDPALTTDLIARCKAAKFDALALTVDAIVAGNRERDYITGMTTPPKLTPKSLLSFALHPEWSINWDDAARMIEEWGGPFAIKGVMSVDDVKRCVDVGASAIMVSNHGGRQLDGSRSPFDQLDAIVDSVGGQIEIILDGGVRRGSHVLKALAKGATACSGGRMYLYALAGAGSAGVERAMTLLKAEIERDMVLMGCRSIAEFKPSMLASRS